MQGSFSILSMLYRSCSISTDFPVPRSPARIVRLFLGIPFGRTLSKASIPVSNDFGSPTTLSVSTDSAVEIKDIVTGLNVGRKLKRRHPPAQNNGLVRNCELRWVNTRSRRLEKKMGMADFCFSVSGQQLF